MMAEWKPKVQEKLAVLESTQVLMHVGCGKVGWVQDASTDAIGMWRSGTGIDKVLTLIHWRLEYG